MSTHREHGGSAVDADQPLTLSPEPSSEQALSEGPPNRCQLWLMVRQARHERDVLSRPKDSASTPERRAWESPRPGIPSKRSALRD